MSRWFIAHFLCKMFCQCLYEFLDISVRCFFEIVSMKKVRPIAGLTDNFRIRSKFDMPEHRILSIVLFLWPPKAILHVYRAIIDINFQLQILFKIFRNNHLISKVIRIPIASEFVRIREPACQNLGDPFAPVGGPLPQVPF